MRKLLVIALLLNAVLLAARCWQEIPDLQAGGEPVATDNGDVNGDTALDISDAVYLLTHLFHGGPAPVAIAVERATTSAVTPTRFGAIGDGVADDTAAVQSALDTGRVVQLEGGRYRITRRLDVPAGGGVSGPGTIYHDFDASPPPGNPSPADTALHVMGDGVLFQDFAIEKRFRDGSYGHGIVAERVDGLSIRGLDISGYSSRYGIHIIESTDFEVRGCHIHDFLVNSASDMIQDSPAGLRITRSHRGVVAGNRVVAIEVGPAGRRSLSPIRPEYGPQGYQSDHITVVSSSRIAVTGNVCTTSGEGIDLLLSNSCVVTDNVISDIWFQGIKMLGASLCTVNGNLVSDCYQGIGLAYHGGLDAEASGNSIVGNVLRDIGSAGSFGIPAADRVQVGGTHGIDVHDPGTCRSNVIGGNVIADTQPEPTTESGVRNLGGPTNRVVDNVFTDDLTVPSAD